MAAGLGRSVRIFGIIVLSAILQLLQSQTVVAQASAKFSFEGIANCHQPYIRNFPIRGDGVGKLELDRTARLEMNSNVEGRVGYDVKLGAKPTEIVNGTAALRVVDRRTLRAIREYPNNILIIELSVRRNVCTIKVENKLKPGKPDYTFQTPLGLAHCEKPTITNATCGAN